MLQQLQKVGELASRPAVILCWALLSLVVAAAGPFGSFQAHGFAVRLGFWATTIGLSIILANVVTICAMHCFARFSALTREVLCLTIFSALFTPIVWGLVRVFMGSAPLPLSIPAMFLFIAAIAGSTIVIRLFFLREAAIEADTDPATQEHAQIPPILARLNECKRGTVIALSARDHYVDVITTREPINC